MRKTVVAAIAMTAMASMVVADAGTALDKNELLTAQNKYRAEVGLPPLQWSDTLAQSAQQWAEELAKENQMRHSGAVGRGENLAMWTTGKASLTQLVAMWGNEKKWFIHTNFPNVSTSGDWHAVAHYTQLVWRNTTDVGCGIASGGGNDYLVCQYSPQGNLETQQVY
ncbi:MAG: CAP family protein [Rhizomicrobium sp.]|jgi:hypothetical protein